VHNNIHCVSSDCMIFFPDSVLCRMFYGLGGAYEIFAGKDASRALAKMSFEPQDLTGDISGLTPFELSSLNDWEYKFTSKYVKVGTIRTAPAEEDYSSISPEARKKLLRL
jgi:membrane-associated progesterone receptor component